MGGMSRSSGTTLFFSLILAVPLCVTSVRTVDKFDDGFRFFLGDPSAPAVCNASDFSPLDGVQCLGFSQVSGVANASACQAACCSSYVCETWTYERDAGCWTSSEACSNSLNNSNWSGGFRAGAPRNVTCTADSPCAEGYDDSAWRGVSLPHDFGVESAFDPALDPGKGCLPKNVSWYRRTFSLPARAAPDALAWLEFDGVFRAADVYLNGAFLAHHEEGYTGFVVWLHNASVPARAWPQNNTLAVFVDGREPELWSYEGMGITRHAWLHTQPPLGAVPWGLFLPAPALAGVAGGADAPQFAAAAALAPQLDLAYAPAAGAAARVNGSVVFALSDLATGAPVCASPPANFSLAPGGWARVVGALACGSADAPVRLWNTAEGGAALYNATATVFDASSGEILDAVSTRVGLRSAVFSAAEGFTLNGARVVLRGFSNHVGFGGCGGAVPDRVLEFQLTMLRSIGGNAYRTAHNPVPRALLDLADEYGVLVWEENRFVELGVLPSPRSRRRAMRAAARGAEPPAGGASEVDEQEIGVEGEPPPPAAPPAAVPRLLQDCQDMVLRDRNHASIVIWSLCNELGCLSDSPTGHVIASQFKQAIYYADLSRAVTGNIVQRPYLGGRLIDEFGMSLDVAAFSHENENVPAYRLQSGWRSVGLGESGSCFFDRGAYAGRVRFGAGVLECTAADLATLALPYVFGAFSWTLNDYLGETYPTGWPSVSSHFGTFDLAGFAKESAGLYGAVWRACDAARVALANADWTAPVPVGATLDVAAYGCAPSIELFVNGVSAGAQPTAALAGGGAVWRGVVFAPGNVTAVARDAAGRALGAASLLSAGAPAALRLWVESPYRAPRNGSVIAADGADAALLGVSVLDAAGRLCPQAALNVTFTVQGPAAVYGVANGDPDDHSPVKATPWRLTFHGLARLIIMNTGTSGPITVTATADGVLPATAGLVAE